MVTTKKRQTGKSINIACPACGEVIPAISAACVFCGKAVDLKSDYDERIKEKEQRVRKYKEKIKKDENSGSVLAAGSVGLFSLIILIISIISLPALQTSEVDPGTVFGGIAIGIVGILFAAYSFSTALKKRS